MKALPSIVFNEFKGSARDVTAKVYKDRQVLSVRDLQNNVTTITLVVRRCSFANLSEAFRNARR